MANEFANELGRDARSLVFWKRQLWNGRGRSRLDVARRAVNRGPVHGRYSVCTTESHTET